MTKPERSVFEVRICHPTDTTCNIIVYFATGREVIAFTNGCRRNSIRVLPCRSLPVDTLESAIEQLQHATGVDIRK